MSDERVLMGKINSSYLVEYVVIVVYLLSCV